MRFFSEAKRRRVFRTAGLYAVAAAGIWGAAEVAVDALGLPSQGRGSMPEKAKFRWGVAGRAD